MNTHTNEINIDALNKSVANLAAIVISWADQQKPKIREQIIKKLLIGHRDTCEEIHEWIEDTDFGLLLEHEPFFWETVDKEPSGNIIKGEG